MVAIGTLQPGPTTVGVNDTTAGPYDDNAYNTSEGQILFEQMNCSGCHSNGGGGMGPPLMDDVWIYGSTPDQVFASIAEGRPNGMPTWKYRLTNKQIWQLVAYVRSLSGLTPKGARASREDHMMVKPAPAQTPNAKPKNAGTSGGD
jgi:cytochrome c oxidase cbb3-type subunit 3